ncbi:MAG: hypothetical protein AAF975_08985, partial [Spirochaetota bacterium]
AQNSLRVLSLCLTLLFIVADVQTLAVPNINLILRAGFYSSIMYALTSGLLFLVSPASVLQGALAYSNTQKERIDRIKLHCRLWLGIPLRNILYGLEIILALTVGATFYILGWVQEGQGLRV